MRNTLLSFALGLTLLTGSWTAAVADVVCASVAHGPSVGKAFTVHGRLSAWNGAPTHRIWIVGTKRMLGVHAGTPMPDNLKPFTQSFDVQVIGDFVVCPVTTSRPGVMQMVGIVSASHLQPQARAME